MSDEFSYTFKRHSIVLTRNDGPLGNWYIRVTAPDGCYVYDGWWADSAGKPLKDALYEAKVGAMLLPKPPLMDPLRAREIAGSAASDGVQTPDPWHNACNKHTTGRWLCSRAKGHEGPCDSASTEGYSGPPIAGVSGREGEPSGGQVLPKGKA
jgi:hypothetical protein